ncbi:MAG: 4Fe-4S dicluster domain-containing protein [Dehalococcoidia bacterium]|jgi:electron transfer flavoprotein alpha subunit|nr:MAG: 4Fe-4S dicluster domain-containing protein [Dehalococcoidia bacterium]
MTPEQPEKKIKRPRGVARLLPGKCIACGARCQSACPKDAITMNEQGEPVIDISRCIGCQKCVKVCPATALEMFFTEDEKKILAQIEASKGKTAIAEPEEAVSDEEAALQAKLKQYRDVWIFVEHDQGEPASVAWELLGVGGELAAKRGAALCAVVVGDGVEKLCQQAFAYGAAKAYLIDDPAYHHYRTSAYNRAICFLAEKYKPEILLMGATGQGRDLAGAVATTLGTGLTADCTGLDISGEGQLLQTRPAFGGNIMATILTEKSRPQMASVRPRVMRLPEKDASRQGEVIRERLDLSGFDFLAEVLEVAREKQDMVDVAAADVVIAGGRGMCGQENFTILEELAAELGGVVGCSRGAVEAGWMPVERQIGQTGKTVRPKIYIAAGISGAIQHLVGMQDSDIIIAINRDQQAPIFEVATYGIIGDVFQVVPALIKRLRELREKKAASLK